jgi:hypothetical protein
MGGVSISVIGYFLKASLNELRHVKELCATNQKDIEVMRNDYLNKISNLNDKFDILAESVRDLTLEIKELNKELNKKKD